MALGQGDSPIRAIRPVFFTALLALVHAGSGTTITAQVVNGTLSASDSGEPIEGAMIHLLDGTGVPVVSRLSDAAGRFTLQAPGPGTYTVRADRIGHASTVSEALHLLEADTRAIQLRAAVEVIRLEGIEVRSDKRCVVRPAEGEAADRVWTEARKALEAARFSDEHGIYRYKIRHFDRRLDARARRIEEERLRLDNGWRKRTFTSLPAQFLADSGYVRPDGDGFQYNAPDAEVLLSDAFLDGHCFRVALGEGEDQGLIGLEFEPIRGHSVPDIAGAFWLDTETTELRRIDYRYVNLRPGRSIGLDDSGLDLSRIGGRVDFQRLPSGPWVVRSWEIRMPLLGSRPAVGRHTAYLAGIQQQGAEVVRIEDNRRRVVLEAATATIAGSVIGEFNTPVTGAAVRLVGTAYETATDSGGSFRLPGVLGGTYEVVYAHPLLDSLGFTPNPVTVDAAVGEVTSVRFRMPSRWDVLSEACSDEGLPEGTAAVLGFIREVDSGLPVEGARVQVHWSDWELGTLDSGGRSVAGRPAGRGASPFTYRVEEGRWTLEVASDARGFFLVCGVPVNHPVRVAHTHGSFRSEQPLRLTTEARSHHLDLEVDPGAPPGREGQNPERQSHERRIRLLTNGVTGSSYLRAPLAHARRVMRPATSPAIQTDAGG